MRYGDMGWRDAGFGLGHIFFVLVCIGIVIGAIVLLILGIRWLLRQDGGTRQGGGSTSGGSSAPAPKADDPLEILRQRYARGEIDDEEFERRRRILGG